jgi:hypothetical protein
MEKMWVSNGRFVAKIGFFKKKNWHVFQNPMEAIHRQKSRFDIDER